MLAFEVVITNGSDVELDPAATCPGYFMNFGESSVSAVPVMSLLNCDDAHPIVSGGSERFSMEIEIPAELDLEAGSVYWRLEPSLADASSPEIAVSG